ncbi:hypothetical protein ACSSS7_004714 [Eimeria intestinalis]
MTPKKLSTLPATSAAALLLLLLATTLSAAMSLDSLPSNTRGGSGGSSSGSQALPEKLGKLNVKIGGSHFLSAGETVSATRGDLRIKGFDARMRFNSVTLGTTRAAGLKAQRKVRMPFTRGLAEVSNRAAAAAVSRSASEDQQASGGAAPMTTEEKRQRILHIFRNLLPCIRRRVLLIRLRRRGLAAQPQQARREEISPSSAAGGEQEEIGRVKSLKRANKQLRKVNSLLLLAVRGLIRKAVDLRRQLQEAKHQQQQQQQQQQQEGEGDSETGEASSSGETPEQLNARRVVLLRQYPPTASSLN